MKTLRTITALTLLIFGFSSCDKAEDLLDQDLNFSLDETFNVTGASGEYSNSTTINPAVDDGNIGDNLDNIKDYAVEKMSITVSGVNADPSANISNMIFTLTHSSGVITVTSPASVSLAALQSAGETDLNVDQNILQGIKSMLVAGGDITLGAKATVENGPASFDLKISIAGKVTVGL